MLMSPLQQQDSSPESTPSRVRSLVDIYDSCNTTMVDLNAMKNPQRSKGN